MLLTTATISTWVRGAYSDSMLVQERRPAWMGALSPGSSAGEGQMCGHGNASRKSRPPSKELDKSLAQSNQAMGTVPGLMEMLMVDSADGAGLK